MAALLMLSRPAGSRKLRVAVRKTAAPARKWASKTRSKRSSLESRCAAGVTVTMDAFVDTGEKEANPPTLENNH